ncbi:MAG: 1-acyl-sn-glycerol-3-phosphate acyltransferase [Bacteroidales bacterium]|nr:1-acyl-sn-glycerol-3-phosphate acyltransferase [Bacteroidales bacterium]
MKKTIPRFDMARDPIRTRWYLKPITKLLSWPDMLLHKPVIRRHGTEGLKPPYILLCNHNAFMDFKVATQIIYPNRANYVVAIDGFIGREWLLRNVGCICKRKFTNDTVLVRQLRKVLDNKDIAVIYPEARYSLCGTTAVLPASIGKLCKMMKAPVASLICHGHHVNSPFWNLHSRGVKPTEADFTLLFTPEQLEAATVDEINDKIVEAFQYDDFAWQKERGILTPYEKRAEGLQKVLYQCPHCGTEYHMSTRGAMLWCNHCGKEWEMTELGELRALEGDTEFHHIPDWYEWERSNVRAEVREGRYSTGELPVHVYSLPNALRFIRLGDGKMIHDSNGFRVWGTDVDGDPFEMVLPVPSLYSCHIEYEYLGKYGDCVDLNTLQDTWYTYPYDSDFSVTKMALATEELYYFYRESIGKPCRSGLA